MRALGRDLGDDHAAEVVADLFRAFDLQAGGGERTGALLGRDLAVELHQIE